MIGDSDKEGIIPLAVKDIFKQIKEETTRKFSVRIGYIEIYNDKIYDLFNKRKTGLNIFEVEGAVTINQKEFTMKSEGEVLKKFSIGNRCKQMFGTSTNKRSSRSHTIFRITIESHSVDGNDESKTANLFLVDLAGSEKPDSAKLTFNEGLHINKSLLVLGKIIRELSKKKSNLKQVSFRECKLTRILSPALGGNSLTAVICTVSPCVLDETYRTICFAQNAEKGKTHPVSNSTPKPASAMKCDSPASITAIKHVRFEIKYDIPSSEGDSAKPPEKRVLRSLRRLRVSTPSTSVSKLVLRRPRVSTVSTGESKLVLRQNRVSTPSASVSKQVLRRPRVLTAPTGESKLVLRRPRVSTPSASESDLSIPCKKAKKAELKITPTNRCSFIARHRVVQSITYEFRNGKAVIENTKVVTEDRGSTNGDSTKSLKEKDDEIKSLETQLEATRQQFYKHRLQFKSKLECKNAAIDTIQKLHIENMQAANDQINSLQGDIQAFEKDLMMKQTDLKELESKNEMSRNKSNDLTRSFDKKFKNCHKQYENLLLKRKEELVSMEKRLSASEKEMKSKRVADFNAQIELEHHYDAKLKKALAKFEVQTKDTQRNFEEKLKEQENHFKIIISEKDEEIHQLKTLMESNLLASSTDDIKLSSLSKESIYKRIENVNKTVLKSIQDLDSFSEHSVSRLFLVYNDIKSLIREVKSFVGKPETPEKQIASPQSISPSSSSSERNSYAIKGGSCPYCTISLRKAALERHIRSKHSSQGRMFECDECPDTFKTAIGISSHKITSHGM